MIRTGVLVFILIATSQVTFAKNRKVQEVNFSDMSLKGTIRTPDGAFLVQKKGIKFMPLYNVQKDFDAKIRDSVNYVR